MTSAVVFDRDLLRHRRDRASSGFAQADFLLQQTANNLLDRLSLIKKELPFVLDLGGAHGILAQGLRQRIGTQTVISTDLSHKILPPENAVVADEEFLPFKAECFDAVVSNLALHWVNDLPGSLLQIRNSLKADGVFMAAVLGGESLRELKTVLAEAEMAVQGGVSPRTSPLLDMRDMGALLQRAGFSLPVVDAEIITVDYADMFLLMRDLRAMGAANATLHRSKNPLRRETLFAAARMYQQKFGNPQGRITATFEVIYAIGWKPHASQQKPLKPGSASARLAQVLESVEEKI